MNKVPQLSLNFGEKRFSQPIVLKLASHVVPDFKESKGKDYISFGLKNDYPNFLIKLYNSCGKHAAIINRKVNYTTGGGWIYAPNVIENEKLNAFVKSVNENGESFNDITMKCDMDLEIFGGFYLEIIWSKSGKTISSIKHVDYSRIRSSADNKEFFYTKDWQDKYGHENRKPEINEDWAVFQPFNAENPKGVQLFYYKSYRPDMNVYALPEYLSVIESIEIDTLISNHNYNDVKNGFVGKTMINFLNGQPSDEEEPKRIEKALLEKFTGTNGQRVILNFADGKDKAAEVVFLTQPDFYKALTELRLSVEQEIFTGHSVTSPMLFGIKTAGQLGGRSEMIDAYELFKNTYIEPKQNILEAVFNKLLGYAGYVSELILAEASPITEKLTEQTLTQILTVDELRALAGYELKKTEVSTTVITNAKMQFAKETFAKYGEPKEKFEVVNRRPISFTSTLHAVESELNIYRSNFNLFSALERGIMDLLFKDNLLEIAGLALALGASVKLVTEALKGLISSGLIEEKKGRIPSYNVTGEGKAIIKENPAKTEHLSVRYEYVERHNAKALLSESREFCIDLMASNKLFSREDIENMSNEMGLSVWKSRGGWYTDPDTNVSRPNCRHIWEQVLVKEKK